MGPGDVVWTDRRWYENTALEDEVSFEGSFRQQYFDAFYVALSSLVGNPVIVPITDIERTFEMLSALLAALILGYIVGEIGTVISSYDRQASLVDERMQIIGEWLRWRHLPRPLAIRVRRYCKHFYTHRTVFDESTILESLSPALHIEVVQQVLKDTLGRLPIVRLLTPSFQQLIFPLLKPRRLGKEQVIFHRGADSDDLLFLIDGEIRVLSWVDDSTPVILVRPSACSYRTGTLHVHQARLLPSTADVCRPLC